MATNLGEILNRLKAEAEAKTDTRMAEGEALFKIGQEDQVLSSQWKRNEQGELVDPENNTLKPDSSLDLLATTLTGRTRTRECLNLPSNADNFDVCNGLGPGNALRNALVLQKLGFRVVEKNTVFGKLKLVESVENWRQRNEIKQAPVGQEDVVRLNSKQIGSEAIENLTNMVRAVNMNPSVLNKGWKPPKMTGDEYKAPVGPTPSTKASVVPAFSWAVMSGGANVEGEVAAINNVIKADSFAIKLGAGLESTQLGGGEKEYALSLDKVDDKAVFALRRAYHDLRARLESRGKQLDGSDQATIEEQLKKFEDAHRRLLLSIELLRAMNDLVEKGLITKEKVPVSEVLEKQHHLVKRVEDRKRKVMVILSSLGTAVAVEAPTQAPVTTPVAVGTEIPRPLDELVVEL